MGLVGQWAAAPGGKARPDRALHRGVQHTTSEAAARNEARKSGPVTAGTA